MQTLYTQQGINMFKLQKRVDAVIIEIENMYLSGAIGFDTVKKLEQALKGKTVSNEELSKIGMMFIHWIQVHRESINRFEDFRNCFVDDPDEPVHSKRTTTKRGKFRRRPLFWVVKRKDAMKPYLKKLIFI